VPRNPPVDVATYYGQLKVSAALGEREVNGSVIRNRIEAKINQGEFLGNMLHVVGNQGDDAQEDFVTKLSGIASAIRELLDRNELVRKITYEPSTYWPSLKGKAYSFIDGGVASIDLPSAAPIGIRVGSYTVRPGDESERREAFNIELSLVDDLFGGTVYDDNIPDIAKLRDAARMVSEVAAVYSIARNGDPKPDGIILHGPLVNPAAPYGLENFPAFSLEACKGFLGDRDWNGDSTERTFVSFYRRLLECVAETRVPVVGAVERSIGQDPVFLRTILKKLVDEAALKPRAAKDLEDAARSYGLNDAALLGVVLDEGEYVVPIAVNRQGPESKWPEDWKYVIRGYPDALTTYIKPNQLSSPFRVEAFVGGNELESMLELIFNTSRLLPTYGFPVGLDIVDKFAKVPAWLSKGVKGQHQVVLLKKALESGDPRTIAFAKRVLAAKSRDWLFRPTA
jgi:hypothetical protein